MPKIKCQLNHGWKRQYNAATRLYDYIPGEPFLDWESISDDPWPSDHVQPTGWHAVEHIYDSDCMPCLVDTLDRYHIEGNAILGYLGLDYAGAVETIRAEWLMDEAVSRLAGSYDILMNARSWYDAARAIDGWADKFWSLYRNLRHNPRRAWGSFKRFAKHYFHRSIHKAPEEVVRGFPATAREYCAIKYGALPIIHDLRDTLKRVQKPTTTVRVVATASAKADPLLVFDSDLFRGIKTWRFTDSASAIAVRYLSADSIESFSNFGDLVQTPLYTVWDAIPWSFVIDWFLPVGSVLLQLQPFGFNVTRGFDCYRYRGHNVLQVSDGSILKYGSRTAKCREFTRRVNTSTTLGLDKAISHYITNNPQLSYARQVGQHLIDLYALGRSRLH